jgi:hypothetical protein
MSVNWRRGLFRAWLLLSFLWAVGMSTFMLANNPPDNPPESLGFAIVALLPLIVGGIILGSFFAIRWVVRGFIP